MNDNFIPSQPKEIAIAIREIRFIVADNGGVNAYVNCKTTEGIIGVDGWHFKNFPPGTPIDMILAMMFTKDPFAKWPMGKPDQEKPIITFENQDSDNSVNQIQESPRIDN